MIVYDKEQKQIVIPNGIGNINLFNNGVEAGYNDGYEQGRADIAANARVIEVTKNGVYGSEVSDPIIPDVTGVYADGTEFYNYAELTGIQYNTGIKVSENTKLEIWYKPKDFTFRDKGGLIGTEYNAGRKVFSLFTYLNRGFAGQISFTDYNYTPKDPNKWFHLELSFNEGFFVDGANYGTYQEIASLILGKDIYINKYESSADGYFGMIKINDTIIIPTADGFLNTNTGELLEVVRDGKYTFIKNEPIYGEGELIKTVYVNVPDLNGSYDEGYKQGKIDGVNEQKSKLESINITENGTYTKEDGYNEIVVDVPTGGGDKPTPPQDGWGMTGVFNDWGGTPDIPFNENGEWEGRPYKVIRNFEATGGEFKIRRNNDVTWTDVYTANFYDIPQFALLRKDDWNMPIDDGVWDIYLFFGNDGVPNEMLILHTGTDLSTIKYEYTLTITTDKENAIIDIVDGYTNVWDGYSDIGDKYCGGSATVTMKLGNSYNIGIYMEGYEDIYEDLICRNDEERTYTLTKIEGYGCISPIIFSKDAGNTINAKKVQIPTFVYEGNQYYNIDSFNLADIEEFKIQILFKPNNSGDSEPINIFGCETPELNSTTFGARIYRGEINFSIDRLSTSVPYTENTWYDVEMGYNTTKRWVIVNGLTLFNEEHTGLTIPSQTLMIGAINKGGNALRPFYGKIAATYIKSNANQVWLLPKEDGTMDVYWNNLINRRSSISGENNARFENDNLSGDGMKSITWLGNLEDKWVTPSMNDRDSNGYIVVSPSEGYSGLKRTVINPQTIYNEGLEAGRADAVANAKALEVTKNGQYGDGETLYKTINVNVIPKINLQKTGLKLGYSTFTEVPEWADFDGITDLSCMFSNCFYLQTIPLIDTSNVTNMNFMLDNCQNLQTIPHIDTSNVSDMNGIFRSCIGLQTIPLIDTSNVTNMIQMFYMCQNLQTIPHIDTSNATNMNQMFYSCKKLTSLPALNVQSLNMASYEGIFGYQELPKLTDFGGLLNLKQSLTDDKNLKKLPNLTYESCINVLNGLYDFTGNGETPNSNQGKLKVHQNFLDKVGDEISIGISRGWVISA